MISLAVDFPVAIPPVSPHTFMGRESTLVRGNPSLHPKKKRNLRRQVPLKVGQFNLVIIGKHRNWSPFRTVCRSIHPATGGVDDLGSHKDDEITLDVALGLGLKETSY